MAAPTPETKDMKSSYFSNGPGPAFLLPPLLGAVHHDQTKPQMPAYSVTGKPKPILVANGVGPGPAYAIPVGMTAKGPWTSPAYTMRMRTKVIENFNTAGPGPAAYNPDINSNRRSPPQYSLSSRHKLIERGNQSPGPIYLLPPCLGPVVPDKPAAQAVSVKSRAKELKTGSGSPGPIYDIVRPDVYKWRAAEVSMKGSRDIKNHSSYNAGPASYSIGDCKATWRTAPAASLGIRHSQFAGTMITECDKEPY